MRIFVSFWTPLKAIDTSFPLIVYSMPVSSYAVYWPIIIDGIEFCCNFESK